MGDLRLVGNWAIIRARTYSVADRGGGGQGVRTPLLGHDVGFLTLGPKLDPLLDPLFLLVDLRWTPPPFKNPGSGPDTSVIPVTP